MRVFEKDGVRWETDDKIIADAFLTSGYKEVQEPAKVPEEASKKKPSRKAKSE